GGAAARQLLPRLAGDVPVARFVRAPGRAAAGDPGLPLDEQGRPRRRPRAERRRRALAAGLQPRGAGELGDGVRRAGAVQAPRAGGAVGALPRPSAAPVPGLRAGRPPGAADARASGAAGAAAGARALSRTRAAAVRERSSLPRSLTVAARLLVLRGARLQ